MPTLDHCTGTCNLNMNEYDTSMGVANPMKVFSMKMYFHAIRESFHPRKKPTLQYSNCRVHFVSQDVVSVTEVKAGKG